MWMTWRGVTAESRLSRVEAEAEERLRLQEEEVMQLREGLEEERELTVALRQALWEQQQQEEHHPPAVQHPGGNVDAGAGGVSWRTTTK